MTERDTIRCTHTHTHSYHQHISTSQVYFRICCSVSVCAVLCCVVLCFIRTCVHSVCTRICSTYLNANVCELERYRLALSVENETEELYCTHNNEKISGKTRPTELNVGYCNFICYVDVDVISMKQPSQDIHTHTHTRTKRKHQNTNTRLYVFYAC